MKPKIGIIASLFTEPHFHLLQNTVGYDYIHSVEAAGGIPIIIPVIDQRYRVTGTMNTVNRIKKQRIENRNG